MQLRTAPAGVVMLSVTCALLLVTVLPPASWTATAGWAVKTVLSPELEGLMVKASLAAGPTATVNVALKAVVSEPDVAVRV